ncbi:Rhythmically expressed protein [Halotydeus destructor]|nr:Rhythmically expressed protein [Halotydeus destructor]
MSQVLRTKLITFDGNGVLFKLRNTVGYLYAQVANDYGCKLSKDHEQRLTNAFKSQWSVLNAEHPNFGSTTGLTSQRWWSLMVSRVFREAGVDESLVAEKRLDIIAAHLYKQFSTSMCWEVKNNSNEVLRTIRTKYPDIKIGVISNTDERLDKILFHLELRHYFNFIIDSFSAKCEKPGKEIFNMAAKLGSASQGNCVHVGDNSVLDYQGARDAGWSAFLLSENTAGSDKNVSNHVITSLHDLVNKLE